MSTQVEIDTSVLEQMDFESGCELVLYWYLAGTEHSRCSKAAYAVANVHSGKNGCVTRPILICKDCLCEWITQNCHRCSEPYVRNWMII